MRYIASIALLAAGCFDFSLFDNLPSGDGSGPPRDLAVTASDGGGDGPRPSADLTMPGWVALQQPTGTTLRSVSSADGKSVFVVGDGGYVTHSDDGGDHWLSTNVAAVGFRSVWAASATTAFLAGDGAQLYRTDNAGMLYGPVVFGVAITDNLVTVTGTSMNDIWVAGDGGTLLHFDGVSWKKPMTPFGNDMLSAGCAPAAQSIALVDVVGNSFAYVGGNWYVANCATNTPLNSISCPSSKPAWTVGINGVACTAKDMTVATWNVVDVGATGTLNGVSIAPGGTIVIVGDGGTIVRSTDGSKFTGEKSNTTKNLLAVWGNDTREFAVGESGIILRHQ